MQPQPGDLLGVARLRPLSRPTVPVFRDDQTGSVWDITGSATSGELAGTTLDQIHHLDAFWFAWSTYQPDTDLVDGT